MPSQHLKINQAHSRLKSINDLHLERETVVSSVEPKAQCFTIKALKIHYSVLTKAQVNMSRMVPRYNQLNHDLLKL